MNLIIRSYVHSYENGNQFFMVGLRRKIESPPTQLPKGLFYYLFNVYSLFFLANKEEGVHGSLCRWCMQLFLYSKSAFGTLDLDPPIKGHHSTTFDAENKFDFHTCKYFIIQTSDFLESPWSHGSIPYSERLQAHDLKNGIHHQLQRPLTPLLSKHNIHTLKKPPPTRCLCPRSCGQGLSLDSFQHYKIPKMPLSR